MVQLVLCFSPLSPSLILCLSLLLLLCCFINGLDHVSWQHAKLCSVRQPRLQSRHARHKYSIGNQSNSCAATTTTTATKHWHAATSRRQRQQLLPPPPAPPQAVASTTDNNTMRCGCCSGYCCCCFCCCCIFHCQAGDSAARACNSTSACASTSTTVRVSLCLCLSACCKVFCPARSINQAADN